MQLAGIGKKPAEIIRRCWSFSQCIAGSASNAVNPEDLSGFIKPLREPVPSSFCGVTRTRQNKPASTMTNQHVMNPQRNIDAVEDSATMDF